MNLPEQDVSGPENDDRSEICIALFDERGDFGLKEGSSKTFVIAVSVIRRPDDFIAIATRYPKNTRRFKRTKKVEDSLKFRTSVDSIRIAVVEDVSNSVVDVYAVTYTKSKDKDVDKKRAIYYRGLFKEIVDELMRAMNVACFMVIIDSTNELGKEVGCKIVRDCAKEHGKRIIECKQVRSKDELLLQTHDFVVGGLGSFEEDGEDVYFKKLSDRIKTWFRR